MIVINREVIKKSMGKVLKTIRKSDSVFSAVKLEVSDNILTISSFSDTIDLCVVCECQNTGTEQFVCAVNAVLFSNLIIRMSTDFIDIEKEDAKLTIRSGKMKASVPLMSETGIILRTSGFEVEKSMELSETFGMFIEQCSHAMFADSGCDPRMASFYIEFGASGGYQVTALDGHRLAIRSNLNGDVDKSVLVRGRELMDAMKIVEGQVTIAFSPNDDFIVLYGDHETVSVSLLQDKYYNISNIVGTVGTNEVVVDRQMLMSTINVSVLMGKRVTLDIKEDMMVLSSRDAAGEIQTELPIINPIGCSLRVNLNAKFILEALQSMNGEEVTFKFITERNPVCITDNSASDINIKEFLLPIVATV